MPFVRLAQPGDLGQLAGFDEWKQATAQTVDAGECFVAGHDTDVLAYAIFNRRFFGRPFAPRFSCIRSTAGRGWAAR